MLKIEQNLVSAFEIFENLPKAIENGHGVIGTLCNSMKTLIKTANKEDQETDIRLR